MHTCTRLFLHKICYCNICQTLSAAATVTAPLAYTMDAAATAARYGGCARTEQRRDNDDTYRPTHVCPNTADRVQSVFRIVCVHVCVHMYVCVMSTQAGVARVSYCPPVLSRHSSFFFFF